jgi:hypothetical protein
MSSFHAIRCYSLLRCQYRVYTASVIGWLMNVEQLVEWEERCKNYTVETTSSKNNESWRITWSRYSSSTQPVTLLTELFPLVILDQQFQICAPRNLRVPQFKRVQNVDPDKVCCCNQNEAFIFRYVNISARDIVQKSIKLLSGSTLPV